MGPAAARASPSSRKRDTPMPALPATTTVVAVPEAAAATAAENRASSASRPM